MAVVVVTFGDSRLVWHAGNIILLHTYLEHRPTSSSYEPINITCITFTAVYLFSLHNRNSFKCLEQHFSDPHIQRR